MNKGILIVVLAAILAVAIFTAVYVLLIDASKTPSTLAVSVVKEGLELNMAVEKTKYSLGETVAITFTITNVSNQTMNFTHTGADFDFHVYDEKNNVIYSWLFGAYPIDVVVEPLASNENFTMTLDWPQIYVSSQSFGTPISSGTYYIIGENPQYQLQTTPLKITVEPSPTTLIAAASGVSIAIIGVGLLIYFKKRKR